MNSFWELPSSKNSNVLIVKTGESETFYKSKSTEVSLGDVLRHTILLHLFKDSNVYWLTSEKSLPLLINNHYIIKTFISIEEIEKTNLSFKYIYNFEQNKAIDKKISLLEYEVKYSILDDLGTFRLVGKSFEFKIFEIFNRKWNGENYILLMKDLFNSSYSFSYDIGLNSEVGMKFPEKKWPDKKWNKLYVKLRELDFTVTKQKYKTDLNLYIKWIAQSRLLITSDSLGLHIRKSLGLPVLGVFAPTSPFEIEFSKNDKLIYNNLTYNMSDISVDYVYQMARGYFEEHKITK